MIIYAKVKIMFQEKSNLPLYLTTQSSKSTCVKQTNKFVNTQNTISIQMKGKEILILLRNIINGFCPVHFEQK